MIRTQLDQLLIGTPKPFRDDGEMSAIAKMSTDDAAMLGFEGLEGNQVGDPLRHGGRDKAVHLYAAEHYAFWQEKYPARQPCWKLNHRFGKADVMKTVVKTGKSGSYFRVLETGMVRAGDDFVQQGRPLPEWPLDRLFDLIIGGQHKGRNAELRALSNNPLLAENWRARAEQLAVN